MQHMINSNDERRPLWRRALGVSLRLCCLLALCLALSPSSKAADVYVNGIESQGKLMNDGGSGYYYYYFTPTTDDWLHVKLYDSTSGYGDMGAYNSDNTGHYKSFRYDTSFEYGMTSSDYKTMDLEFFTG